MTNKKRKLEGNEEYRFADVYHSANRTPVSTAEVSWNMFFYFQTVSWRQVVAIVFEGLWSTMFG